MIRSACLWGVLALWMGVAAPASAQDPAPSKPPARSPAQPASELDKTKARPKSKPSKDRRPLHVTAAQEAAVLALVRQHHPEVEALLEELKRANKPQYVAAVRSLFRTSVRLAAIQERDMERYDLELKRWKLESQAQLLALKVCRSKGKEKMQFADQLEQTASSLRDTKVDLLTLERDRKQEELSALEEKISRLQRDPQSQVDSDVELLLRSARNLVNSSKRKPKPKEAPARVDTRKSKNKAPDKDAT